MATFSDVVDDIKNDLVITGADYDSRIKGAVRSALRQLRKKRYFFLQTTGTVTLLTGQSSVALPTDFGTHHGFSFVTGGQRYHDGAGLDFLTYDRLQSEYMTISPMNTGVPRACAIWGTTLYFSDIAAADYTIDCVYYKQDAALPMADGDTSAWFDDGYDLVKAMAQVIFKGSTPEFEVTQMDTQLVTMYSGELDAQNENYFGGR